jgi:hypothetical protein
MDHVAERTPAFLEGFPESPLVRTPRAEARPLYPFPPNSDLPGACPEQHASREHVLREKDSDASPAEPWNPPPMRGRRESVAATERHPLLNGSPLCHH